MASYSPFGGIPELIDIEDDSHCACLIKSRNIYSFFFRIRSKSTENVFLASFLITFIHSAFDGTANIVTESNRVNTSAIKRRILRTKS